MEGTNHYARSILVEAHQPPSRQRTSARLVSGLRTLLPLAPDCEITLEGRVHSFTEDKMEAAFKAGVNRVSLGVQTFDTRIRRSLGRKTHQGRRHSNPANLDGHG